MFVSTAASNLPVNLCTCFPVHLYLCSLCELPLKEWPRQKSLVFCYIFFLQHTHPSSHLCLICSSILSIHLADGHYFKTFHPIYLTHTLHKLIILQFHCRHMFKQPLCYTSRIPPLHTQHLLLSHQ